MGTAVRTAKTSPASWDAFADVDAFVDEVLAELAAMEADGTKPIGREGSSNAHWLLIDYGSVIVHVMAPPERDFYQLERLWADAPLLVRLV